MEKPEIQGQRERGFRTEVKEDEEKHRLWGPKGLFFPPLTKPRSKGRFMEKGAGSVLLAL